MDAVVNHEFTMRVNSRNGKVFCSLTKEEQEAERKLAMENYEKFQELMLAEKAASMSKDDFIKEYNQYLRDEEHHELFLERIKANHVDWDRWRYEQEMYNDKPSQRDLWKWKKSRIVRDHIHLGIWLIAAGYGYIIHDSVFMIFSGIFMVICIIDIGYKWYHFFKTKDTMENLNSW